uniref:Uncharacterized protein n=1 Tax=Sinorhizobium meliloti (strain SM11) TaxID=707241 RepID=Q1WLD4_SINMM|nr:hypothetical protein [Sinorhizobium meliloti]
MGHPVARLSDSDVPADPLTEPVVTLQRKGVLTEREASSKALKPRNSVRRS